jgi:acyl-CoA synthetase (AMP-forming)/AMP-acid ligase II
VSASVLERACAALGPAALPPEALCPAYGLAEATLAVTVRPLGATGMPRTVTLDAAQLADGRVVHAAPDDPRAATWVSCGRPLPGVTVRAGDERAGLAEIEVASTGLTDGYFADPEATAAKLAGDGRLRTGDVGWLDAEGELHVAGRADDVVSVRGRKLFARELEIALDAVPGVRRGCCAVVRPSADDDRLVAIAEAAGPLAGSDLRRFAIDLSAAAGRHAGFALDEVLVVERGSLPKTPSGKLQRFRCAEIARDPGAEVTGRVSLRTRR